MKTFIKILLFWTLVFWIFGSIWHTHAGVDGFEEASGKISETSITLPEWGNTVETVNKIWISILTTIKVVLAWVIVIYIVYIWVQMILSLWTNEEELSSSKRQLMYGAVWLIFINIPGTLYNAFVSDTPSNIWERIWAGPFIKKPGNNESNLFIDIYNFWNTLNGDIIWFLEVFISAAAIAMIIFAGIKMLLSWGKDEKVTEAKNKIVWSLISLIFVWFIEAWKAFAFGGNIDDGADIFGTIANLAIFIAGPVALFFLTLAGYYYITSNGDEDKVKKSKNIVINTLIATVIILASYTFLLDLASL